MQEQISKPAKRAKRAGKEVQTNAGNTKINELTNQQSRASKANTTKTYR